jgi:hypothetical protein
MDNVAIYLNMNEYHLDALGPYGGLGIGDGQQRMDKIADGKPE